MLYRDLCKIFSTYLWVFSLPLLIPFLLAGYYEFFVGKEALPQGSSFLPFLWTILFTGLLGGFFRIIGYNRPGLLHRREALLLVLAVYTITPLIGALPFYFNQTLKPFDAYFEAASALTTTGASLMTAKKYDLSGTEVPIEKTFFSGTDKKTYAFNGTIARVFDAKKNRFLEGIEAVSPPLVFWRSFMAWLGGGGIVVLFVAILPALGVGGKVLFQTEMTGPSKDMFLPRIKETSAGVWKIYSGLTFLQIFLLILTNKKMPVFDAVILSFSTLSTGGFTPTNNGIASYQSAYTDWILVIFMFLGSINFSLYFYCLHGKFSKLKDPELKAFLLILFFCILFSSWKLTGFVPEDGERAYTFWEAIRYSAFQIVSIETTTGFSIDNYDAWPFAIQVVMLVLMFIGGMAGSTAGGLKVIRQQIFFGVLRNKIESIYRPETVRSYRVGASQIDAQTASTILCFFSLAALLTILGTFLLVLDGADPETGLTTIASMLNNTGSAFRMGGPSESFAFLSNFGKILCSVWMIAGRLEFFAVLIIFVPAFWKAK